MIAADLTYDAFLAHRHVRRISGIAVSTAGRVPWSLIEKATGGPASASAYVVDNGRRELAAYRSGLLAELPAGVRAPALHGVSERPDGEVVPRLEDVRPDPGGTPSQDSIVRVARDLGRVAGTWLRRSPQRWFFPVWIERHAQPGAQAAGLDALRGENPAALARLGSRLDLGVRLTTPSPALPRD